MKKYWIVILTCIMIMMLYGSTAMAAQYTLVDLGTLGGNESYAYGINKNGEVTGYSKTLEGAYHAFLYSGGSIKDIGTLGGTQSYAYGINDSGKVAGSSLNSDGSTHGFYYDGTMHDIGTLPGAYKNESHAYAINNAGQIAGDSYTVYGGTYAILYDINTGTPTGLGSLATPPWMGWSYAQGINSSGKITGYSSIPGSIYSHGFIYSGGTMSDVGSLADNGGSGPRDINDAGIVVGVSGGSAYQRAFMYDGAMHDLGALGYYGWYQSDAASINNHGEIVGWSRYSSSSTTHAFWYSDNTMYDLNNLIDPSAQWVLNGAYGINDIGQIVGHGLNPQGESRAFLLTPTAAVPEPATLSLLGLGLLGLVFRKKR